MTQKTIHVSVSGATGSGKTELCEVIHNAIVAHYGDKVTLVANELMTERQQAHLGILDDAIFTGQSCFLGDTTIVLTETNQVVIF
jgi:Ni2+-binding GTPase involved in maturation of urease and hydrogenase